jgi:hypothetical protein
MHRSAGSMAKKLTKRYAQSPTPSAVVCQRFHSGSGSLARNKSLHQGFGLMKTSADPAHISVSGPRRIFVRTELESASWGKAATQRPVEANEADRRFLRGLAQAEHGQRKVARHFAIRTWRTPTDTNIARRSRSHHAFATATPESRGC